MSAHYYIYRNLHLKDSFLIRFRGRVIDRPTELVAYHVQFKVSQAGRSRVLQRKQKNVHAFVVAEACEVPSTKVDVTGLLKVWYNPFLTAHFMVDDAPIYQARAVAFTAGQCYLLQDPR